MKRFLFLLILLSTLALAGPGHDHGEGALASSSGPANEVTLTDAQMHNLGLAVAPVEERAIEETVLAYGRLEMLPGSGTVVSSRVPAKVISIAAAPGSEVEAGEPILQLESRQPGPTPPPFPIVAPASGTVARWLVQPGQQVEPQDPLVEIVQLDQLHAVASLFEGDLDRVARLVAEHSPEAVIARIRPIGSEAPPLEASFDFFGLAAEDEGGRVPVHLLVDNPDGRLRPGMRVEVNLVVAGAGDEVLAVPSSAVQGDFGTRFVWVQDWDDPHRFERVEVATGRRDDRFTEIGGDSLFADDLVVTNGAFALQYVGPGATTVPDTHGHSHGPDGSHEDHAEDEEADADAHAGHDHGHGGTPASSTPLATWLVWALAGTSVGFGLLLIVAVFIRGRDSEA